MEDLHVRLSTSKHVGTEDIDVLHALIFHQVGETLFLYTGHIDDVGIGNHLLVEGCMFLELDTVLLAIDLILVGHGQFLRSNEMESGVEVPHGHDEGVHRTTVFEVAHQVDVQVL